MKSYTLEQMLSTAGEWTNTYCELAQGWPDLWIVIFRHPASYGKIGGELTSSSRPSAGKIERFKIKLLTKRYHSPFKCDANRLCESLFKVGT